MGDGENAELLQEFYRANGVGNVDLMVGILTEKKNAAFVMSLLMASRQLEVNWFFTSDFNEKTYKNTGLR